MSHSFTWYNLESILTKPFSAKFNQSDAQHLAQKINANQFYKQNYA